MSDQAKHIEAELRHYGSISGASQEAIDWGVMGARCALRDGRSGWTAYHMGRHRIDDWMTVRAEHPPDKPSIPRMLEILTQCQNVPCTRVEGFTQTADGYRCRVTDYQRPARTFRVEISEEHSLRLDEADSKRVADMAIERARREA